jgi:hypothetical protein
MSKTRAFAITGAVLLIICGIIAFASSAKAWPIVVLVPARTVYVRPLWAVQPPPLPRTPGYRQNVMSQGQTCSDGQVEIHGETKVCRIYDNKSCIAMRWMVPNGMGGWMWGPHQRCINF